MRDWPDPDEPKGFGLMLHIEFWTIAALMMLGFGMAYGLPLFRVLRSIFIAI